MQPGLAFLDDIRQSFRIISFDEEHAQPSRRPRRKVWSEERFTTRYWPRASAETATT
jgi:hypothetical protein